MGDIDGDGVGDVVVSNPEGDHITVFKMTRKGPRVDRLGRRGRSNQGESRLQPTVQTRPYPKKNRVGRSV